MVVLDSPATRLPPLTSFTGFKSRIMASFMSFLIRRQADRTILMFGICLIISNDLPKLFRSDVLATSPGGSKPKRCLIACMTLCERTAHHSFHSIRGSRASITLPGISKTRSLREASEVILALKQVSFHYKRDRDSHGVSSVWVGGRGGKSPISWSRILRATCKLSDTTQ